MKPTPIRAFAIAATLALAACASLTGKREPFTTYAPHFTPPATAPDTKAVAWQLAIDTPLASDTLNSARMLVMPTPGAIETYKSGRWSDTVPVLLRTLLIDAFQTSNRITGVGAVSSGLHGDFMLSVDLYAFETQYRDGAPHAVIRLNAKLTDEATNRITASRMFEADAPVSGTDAASAAAAIQTTLDSLLPQIMAWTFENGQTVWAARKGS
jgi:cholesterol transport system auxiliary component